MFDIIGNFLRTSDYAPHGFCLLWQPELVWTHVVADSLIAIAYFSIPVALVYFISKRRDIQFKGVFWLFAIFIMACGATHLMAIWTLWNADYGIEALVKVVTAIASVGTAIALWPLIPRLLALPSPEALRLANAELAERVAEREQALAALRAEEVERQRAEAALAQAQKMQALGQLTGGIAHDFNNLLQAVLGNLELIQNRAADPERVRTLAGKAQRAIDHGRSLTSKLLAFSRVQRLALTAVQLHPLIETMREMLSRTIGDDVRIELVLQPGDPWVMADASQLELAILNLALNARDAMPGGGVLRIATRIAQQDDGDMIEVSVTDNGTGMSQETAARAFEPFFTTKDVGAGTGLGLSMVYGMARQSGGSARVASVEGQGTTVTIALRPAAPEVQVAPPPGDVEEARIGARRIIVVDDDPAVRSAVSEGLTVLGHQVIEAASGHEALSLLRDYAPDVMVLDYAMPGLNGAEVARLARIAQPGLPVLFVSGYADSDALAAAVGPDAVRLHKPFSVADLTNAIAQTLRQAA